MGVTEFRVSHSTNYTTFYFFPCVNKQTWVWLLTLSPRSQLRGVPNILQGLQTRMAFLGKVNIMFLLMSVKIYEFLNHWQLRCSPRQGNHWLPAQEWTGARFLMGFLWWDSQVRDGGEDSIHEMPPFVVTWLGVEGEVSFITRQRQGKGPTVVRDFCRKQWATTMSKTPKPTETGIAKGHPWCHPGTLPPPLCYPESPYHQYWLITIVYWAPLLSVPYWTFWRALPGRYCIIVLVL